MASKTWDSFHHRGEVLRAVVEEANARRDGVLPMELPGVAETFGDEFNLIADYVVSHYEAMLSLYGRESGLRQARKHLGWYLGRHAFNLPLPERSAIMTSCDPAVVIANLREAFLASEDRALARHVA